MSLHVNHWTIDRVLLIDDDKSVREAYHYPVEECGLEPKSFEGKISSLEEFVKNTTANGVDAAICDHHLMVRDYSIVNGAELVAALYKNNFPALLCTKWEAARAEEIRKFRRYIPVMISPSDLNPDVIELGLGQCIREFYGEMVPSRKPWRTLIRVEDVDEPDSPQRRLYVIVPAWDQNEVVALIMKDLPEHIRDQVKPGFRCYAEVNIGAEEEKDLYFVSWAAG